MQPYNKENQTILVDAVHKQLTNRNQFPHASLHNLNIPILTQPNMQSLVNEGLGSSLPARYVQILPSETQSYTLDPNGIALTTEAQVHQRRYLTTHQLEIISIPNPTDEQVSFTIAGTMSFAPRVPNAELTGNHLYNRLAQAAARIPEPLQAYEDKDWGILVPPTGTDIPTFVSEKVTQQLEKTGAHSMAVIVSSPVLRDYTLSNGVLQVYHRSVEIPTALDILHTGLLTTSFANELRKEYLGVRVELRKP